MEKNQVIKRNIIIAISFVIMVFFKFLPHPAGLTQPAMQVLGIFIGVLILWLTISIDWPSMLSLAALAFVPGLNFNKILSGSVGGSTFSFLMFTFMCTYALSKTSFVRRCALGFINSKMAQKGPWSFALLFFVSSLVLGSFMSPSVLFVIYLPIIEEIYAVLELKKTDKYANMLMIGMTICIGISSGMTPIAHVFSVMAIGFYEAATKLTISYFSYMAFAVPVGILTFIGMMLLFKFVLRPDTSVFYKAKNISLKDDTQPMDAREKAVLSVFGLVIFLWVAPGLIEFVLPNVADYIDSFGTAFPPLLGAVALMIITIDGKPLLSFNEAMSKGVAWASLIMTASTLAIGSAMTNADIGLTEFLTKSIAPALSNLSPFVLVLIFTLWAAIQTNLSSNMVTITVVCAVALPICISSGGALSTPAIASIIGMMGAFAFAAPPAHPNVALASSSGWTTTNQMMVYGFAVMFISVAITVVVGYPIAIALMGM